MLGETVSALDRDARARFRAENVALVSQETGLVPFLTAAENVELGLSLRGVEPEEARARAAEALAAVGLAGAAGRRVSDLSSGQRERVAVARAVAAARRSCSPTSRPRASTRRTRSPSPGCSSASRARPAPRSSAPPTTRS